MIQAEQSIPPPIKTRGAFMSRDTSARRHFLKSAGAGIAASAMAGLPLSASANAASAKAGNGATSPQMNGASASNFYLTAFVAKGDGKSLDTPAINQAIEAAAVAGGGNVVFPAGAYLCYSIHLRSHV